MDEFDKIARRAEEERRKLEQRLQEVEQFAQENSYLAAAHLTVEALYWRRVWRRRLRKLVKRLGGRIIARNGKVLLINANPRWPREGFSFLCAGAASCARARSSPGGRTFSELCWRQGWQRKPSARIHTSPRLGSLSPARGWWRTC